MRIYCTPLGISHVQEDLKKAYPSIEFVKQGGILDKSQTEEALSKETHVIIGSEILDGNFLANSSLKAISRFGGSLENIDTDTAKRMGICVFSYKSSQVISDVANLTVSFVLSSTINLFEHNENLSRGLWIRPSYLGTNSKIKILGSGNVGTLVWERLKTLDFKNVELISMRKLVQSKDTLDSLMRLVSDADILIITASQKCWPKSKFIDCLKIKNKPLKIVNTARGTLVNEVELLKILSERKDISYYTDVFETEPPTDISLSLASLSNVISTPHIGGYSSEALKDVAFKCVDFLVDH